MANFLSFLFKSKESSNKNFDKSYLGQIALNKGNECFQNGRFSEAVEYYDQAIEYGKNEAFAHRGYCLQELNFYLDAIDDFTEAISITPDDCNLYFCRGNNRMAIKDYEAAIEDGEKAIELSKLSSNRRYDTVAKSMGHKSVTEMYEVLSMTWSIEYNPKIERMMEASFQKRLASDKKEDLEYVEKVMNEKKILMRRRDRQ